MVRLSNSCSAHQFCHRRNGLDSPETGMGHMPMMDYCTGYDELPGVEAVPYLYPPLWSGSTSIQALINLY